MSPMVSSPLTTEHALLGFLHQQPTHGYEIHRRLSDSEGLGLVWHVKQNKLYALLAKLESKGYVTTADAGNRIKSLVLFAPDRY